MGIGNSIINGTNQINATTNPKSKKLIIHQTDIHGSGNIYHNGKTHYYSYDDETGDVGAAVRTLIDIGFIEEDDVCFIEGDEIYEMIENTRTSW